MLSSCVIKTYLPPQVVQDKWNRNSDENIRMWKTVSMENWFQPTPHPPAYQNLRILKSLV